MSYGLAAGYKSLEPFTFACVLGSNKQCINDLSSNATVHIEGMTRGMYCYQMSKLQTKISQKDIAYIFHKAILFRLIRYVRDNTTVLD